MFLRRGVWWVQCLFPGFNIRICEFNEIKFSKEEGGGYFTLKTGGSRRDKKTNGIPSIIYFIDSK